MLKELTDKIAGLFSKGAVAPVEGNLTVSENAVSFDIPCGEISSLPWSELTRVDVVTTESGPFEDDIFFVLRGKNAEVLTIPEGHPHADELLAQLQKLPEFSNELYIEAQRSTKNAVFPLWARKI